MRIHIYSGNRIEPWDWRNVLVNGIGGSETSHYELATRLAKRGHHVFSYTDLPKGDAAMGHCTCDDEGCEDCYNHGNVSWCDLTDADFTEGDLWIIYREPSIGAKLPEGCRAWLVCQDVFYPDWKSEDVAKFEKVIGLCPRHLAYLTQLDPANASRFVLSGNGVNVERFEAIERPIAFGHGMDGLGGVCPNYNPEPIIRNPKRLIWASSPDRGLKELLDIFERAQEQVPDLELQIFYGMDNIEKICGGDRTKYPWRDSWAQYDRAQKMTGVTWRGRIGQEQLAREYLASGIWCYPTWFQETSCISCMEAQALGAIPITNPIWATGYNVKHGVFVEGVPSDRLVLSRYVDAVVRLASSPEAQEAMRAEMMRESRERLSWEKIADQWHEMAMSGVRDVVSV